MTIASDDLLTIARRVFDVCSARGLTLTTAESCTGGLVAGTITALPGSSAVLERGFVTYSNLAKSEMLGVPPSLIAEEGAVSEAVAGAMAAGALAHSPADMAVAVTGIAGPSGGSAEKPVGLVHFAVCLRGRSAYTYHAVFDGDRDTVRTQAVRTALELVIQEGSRES